MTDRLLLLAVASVLATLLLTSSDASASFTSRVTVVSHELHAECLDPVFLGCDRPELRVDAAIDTNDHRPPQTCSGPTNGSFFNIVEDQTVCSGVKVAGDYTVRLTLLDVDACPANDPNCTPTTTTGDLTPGPGYSWQVGPLTGGRTFSSRVTTAGGASWMAFTVTAEPVPSTISIFQPAGSEGGQPQVTFDPTLGQRVPFRANLSEPTRVEYSVRRRSTGQSWVLHTAPAWNTSVNLDWDGTAPGSAVPLPDDVYDLQLRDLSHAGPGSPAVASRPVRLLRTPPAVVQVALDDLVPAAAWDFRNGPLAARGTITADGSVRLEVAPRGASCAAFGTPVWEGPAVPRGRGAYELAWDGRGTSGAPVPPGDYCARVRLTSTTGPTRLSETRALTVRPGSAGLEAWAFPDPIVPVTAGQGTPSASIRAMVVDGAHATRHAWRVRIEASPAGPPGQPVQHAPRTIATCERATTCGGALPGDLAAARAIAYRVIAEEAPDAPGGPATWTGPWRITDLNPLPLRTWRASTPAVIDGAGMVTTPPVSSTLDVVYYPGSGNDVDVPAQALGLASQVAGNIAHVFGLGSDRGRSTFATNSTAVSFIVSPQHVVEVRGAGDEMCSWSGIVPVSYADAHGVVHRAGCRDAAYGHSREYSSDNPRTDWHELHHALYNLDDEYCCDSNYDDGVNVYASEAGCNAKSSPGAKCTRLILGGTPAPPERTNNWRGDPLPDVMVANNMVENADDLRAADATYARCRSGRC